MRKINLILLLALITVISACGKNTVEVSVAVAANMTYPMTELEALFEKQYPEYDLVVSFGSSGKLTSMILNGADYGTFLSANTAFPQQLYDTGWGMKPPEVYAQGKLILFSAQNIDLGAGLSVLTQADVLSIAVALPETAPYGKAALEVISNAGLTSVIPKLIYAESIAQTVQYCLTAASAGFINYSSVFSESLSGYTDQDAWIEIDPELYSPILQSMLLLADDPGSVAFYDFMLTDEAREIMKGYGYGI